MPVCKQVCLDIWACATIWPCVFLLLLNVCDYNSLCDNGGVAPHVMAHVCMPPSRCPDVSLRWPAASEGRHQGVLAPLDCVTTMTPNHTLFV